MKVSRRLRCIGHRSDPDAAGLTIRSARAPILAAGMTPMPAAENPAAEDGDNHSDTAWRLRHIKRSVLKQDGSVVSIADAAADQDIPDADTPSMFGRALDNAATFASSFFTGTPFTGEVNLLTTSRRARVRCSLADFTPRGVAYLSIGAPAASGRWDVRCLDEPVRRVGVDPRGHVPHAHRAAHDSAFGVSYSTQQYQNPRARAAGARPRAPTTRATSAKSTAAIAGWRRRSFALEYGAPLRALRLPATAVRSSARASAIMLTPFDANTHITAHVAQRMLAPGAEEFLAPTTVGPWLPPERTFAPLDGQTAARRARAVPRRRRRPRVQRHLRRRRAPLPAARGQPARDALRRAGRRRTRIARALLRRQRRRRRRAGLGVQREQLAGRRASADRSTTASRARSGCPAATSAAIAVWAPGAIRPRSEDIHDLTTSLETSVPQTARACSCSTG